MQDNTDISGRERQLPVSKIGALRAALLKLLGEHERDGALPTSARFLFYELVQRGIVSKEAKGKRRPDQDLHVALTQLRESGEVPWDWIVDETRSLDDFTGASTLREWMLDVLPAARLDAWAGDAPLILTESRSLAGVLRALASEYGALIAPTNGQCAGFLHTKIARALRFKQRVLYLGDLDLSGGQIEHNTRHVLEREVGELDWDRLALTQEQVDEYDLPVIEKRDRRYNDHHPHEAVETEALSQTIIVEIVRNRLEQLLPEPLARVQERAERQRGKIRRALQRLRVTE
jgi:hypothetical protein